MTPDEAQAVTYPVFARPAVRGVYCKIVNGVPIGKNHLRFANRTIHDILSGLPAFEGRILMGDEHDRENATYTQEVVDDADLCERFTFWVYDLGTQAKLPFNQRLPMLAQWIITSQNVCVRPVPYVLIRTWEGLLSFERDCLRENHPGIVTVGPDHVYERPRSLN